MGGIISVALASFACFLLFILRKLLYSCYLKPMKAYKKLKSHGFLGPTPRFPFGNRRELMQVPVGYSLDVITHQHDVHSFVMPFSVDWKEAHGKVCTFWVGTEPFVYVADPEFLRQLSEAVTAKVWKKPPVFKGDRFSFFGKYAYNMLEGDDWLHHKRVIGPAFSSSWLKLTTNTIVDCTKNLSNQWTTRMATRSKIETDVEMEISYLVAEVVAKTNFGIDSNQGSLICTKLRELQLILFNNMFKRFIGVPFGQLLCPKETIASIKIGKELDHLFESIIVARQNVTENEMIPQDLLGLMLAKDSSGKGLTTREVIDECKLFFFVPCESTKLSITWTLVLLAMNKRWQDELRKEIKEVIGDGEINFTMLSQLQKMGWVMNEVLRLYAISPVAVRHATSDIKVGETVIPQGTSIWLDILSMHHDPQLWGESAQEFRPERFADDALYGGCRHKMGFMPFGFGGRMCAGRSQAVMMYKTILCSLLPRFHFSISPSYRHFPHYVLLLRPAYGMQLIIEPIPA